MYTNMATEARRHGEDKAKAKRGKIEVEINDLILFFVAFLVFLRVSVSPWSDFGYESRATPCLRGLTLYFRLV